MRATASSSVAGSRPNRAVRPLAALSRHGGRLVADLARIAVGTGSVQVPPGDARFRDPAWSEHPVYRRMGQTYIASCAFADRVVDEITQDTGRATTARFLLQIGESAAAPTNYLLGNPAAVKRAYETGGVSLVRGMRNLVNDVRHNGAMPATVDRSVYEVGRDLAVTPGAVVGRDSQAELLQYTPTTETVHARPVLVIPPPIGRYYFLDLRPGRSFVEYAVSRNLQTFLLSWRNPGREQSSWSLDTYAARVLTAIDEVREITGAPEVDLIGFCAGGILMTLALNALAARGEQSVHSASYAVTMLDFGDDVPIKAFSAPKLLALARWSSARSGVIKARDMGNTFVWMRPNELVWNYWVNNYLLGNPPPAFDVLAWNADGTNLPARLHAQFLDIFEHNPLCTPGALTVLDTPVRLDRITVPTFVTGGSTDHLTPWMGCYRTTQLLGGPSTFVLSNAGHIQSLVNPPGNPKASYLTGGPLVADPQEWLSGAQRHVGSWWSCWADWLIERSAGTVDAPKVPGSLGHPVSGQAPGRYVRDLAGAGA